MLRVATRSAEAPASILYTLNGYGLVVLFALLLAPVAQAQHHGAQLRRSTDSLQSSDYAIYRGDDGTAVALDSVIAAADTARVVFVGERHDDRTAHALQLRLFHELYEHAPHRAALSLEMLARDVQPIVDEYLDSLITERHYLRAVRPWPNYQRDYHPLVRFARAHGRPVLAANAPRRYVNRAARLGRSALSDLPPRARKWLPPLPYPHPPPAYRARFQKQMQEGTHQHGGPSTQHLMDAQALWDATMGYALAEFLTQHPGARVLHVAGGFHVERGLGTPAMLAHYRPGTPALTLTMRPAGDVEDWRDAYTGLADFVVLTTKPEN